MTTTLFTASALLGGSLLAGCVDSGSTRSDSMAPASLSSDVAALEGMRARNLDSEMNRLGFTNVGGYKTEGASITTWWNPRGEQCVKVETRDGRAASIESIFKGNCQ
jgi:outer membrane murein-binding lipoprotein Lpp